MELVVLGINTSWNILHIVVNQDHASDIKQSWNKRSRHDMAELAKCAQWNEEAGGWPYLHLASMADISAAGILDHTTTRKGRDHTVCCDAFVPLSLHSITSTYKNWEA
jgi:hypothetical protein